MKQLTTYHRYMSNYVRYRMNHYRPVRGGRVKIIKLKIIIFNLFRKLKKNSFIRFDCTAL